jgi:hypothetical protein
MNKQPDTRWLSCIAHFLCCLFIFAAPTVFAQKSKGSISMQSQSQPQSAEQILKLGFFYYNNDDITDKAAEQFRAVITKYPKSNEAETAQYYLGSYYQRKYYVQMEKFRKQDARSLESAKKEYRAYTDKYYNAGSHQWLSDAFFNLALVYLQSGDARNAGYELNKIGDASGVDNAIYIYQVVYSQSYDDVVDSSCNSKRLADYTSSLIKDSRQSFKQTTAAIRDWCRRESGKK